MALLQTLQDDFPTSLDTAKWNDSLGAVWDAGAGGRVAIPGSAANYLGTSNTYDLTGSYLVAKMTGPGYPAAGSRQIDMRIARAGSSNNDSLIFRIFHTSASLGETYWRPAQMVGGVETLIYPNSILASSTGTFRIRESAGTIYWETSPDGGVSWVIFTAAAAPFAVTSVTVRFTIVGSAGGGTAYVDTVNVIPPSISLGLVGAGNVAQRSASLQQPIGDAAARTRQAQSFQSRSAFRVNNLQLALARTGAPADNFIVELQTDNFGLPSGTVLGSQTIAASTIPTTSTWVPITGTISGLNLAANTPYWIVLSRSGAFNASNWIGIYTSNGPSYDLGNNKKYDGSVWTDNVVDLAFQISALPTAVVRGIAVAADVITPAPVLPPLSGLVVQLDASQLTGADGSAVSPWPNLATPGVPGTMISSPAPTKRNNVLNGLPVVRFNTGEGRMRMTGTGVSTDFTLLAVARIHTTGAGAQRVIAADQASTGNNFLLGWWNQFQDCVFDGAWASGQPTEPATTAWRLYSFDKVGAGAARIFSNGQYLRSGGSGASNLGGSLALSGHDATTESSNCDVAEILLYNRVLSDSERVLVEDYLRRKWTTYAAQILSLSPRAYYRLGEPSGTQAIDLSPNVRHGTYTGGVTLAQPGAISNNNAISLDGVDDWVALPTDTASLATATSEITLEAWYKGTDTDGSIISARDTSPTGNPIINFGLGQQGAGTGGTGKLNLCVRDNAGVGLGNVATDYVVNDGVWHHLVATRNSAKLWTLYIDGLPNGGTLTDAMTSAVTGMTLQAIGSERKWVQDAVNVGTLQYLAGRVDEVAIYGVALTPAEILLHYRLRMSQARNYQDRIKLLEPIVYYRLNETSGTQAADYSGNNRHGTIVGTPLYGQTSPFADGTTSIKLGNGAYITIPNSVSLPAGSPVTFEWWEYKASAELVASSAFEMGLPDDTVNRCQCHGPWVDGTLFWDYGNISTTGRISQAMPLDQWVLVHLIFDGIVTRAIYFNGALVNSNAAGGSPTVAKTGGDIGGSNGAHTARMKDFAIYNRYIPTNEKLAHYNAASWTIAPEGVGIGRRVSTMVVRGVTLVGVTPLAIGRCAATTSVKGITLAPGPVTVSIGRIGGLPFSSDTLDNFTDASAPRLLSAYAPSSWANLLASSLSTRELKTLPAGLAGQSTAGFTSASYWIPVVAKDVAVWVTFDTVPSQGFRLWARMPTPGTVGTPGYRLFSDNSDLVTEYFNGTTNFQLSDQIWGSLAGGDSLGFATVGNKLTSWYKPAAGSWGPLFSNTDSNLSAPGYIGIEVDETACKITAFGGGAVPLGTSVVKGITLTVAGAAPLSVGRVAAVTISRGIIVTATGAAGLPVGSRISVTTTKGVTLTATGTVSVSIGRRLPSPVVRGVTPVATGAAGLPIGRVIAATVVRGSTVVATGSAPLAVGRRAAATTTSGVTLLAAGVAPLPIGKKLAATVIRGMTLVATGTIPIPVGHVGAATAVRGVILVRTGYAVLRLDKVAASVASYTGGFAGTSTLTLLGRNANAQQWDGLIAEVVIFDRALTDAEIASVETFLHDKWIGDVVQIPVGRRASSTVVRGITVVSANQIFPITLAATMTLTPVLTGKGVYFRTLAVNMTTTPVLVRVAKYLRAVAATMTLTPALVRTVQFLRTLPATVTLIPARAFNAAKSIAATVTLAPVLIRKLSANRAIAATTTITPTMTSSRLAFRTLPVTVTLTPALSRLLKFYRSLPVTVTLTSSMARVLSGYRVITVTVTLTPVLARRVFANRLFSAVLLLTPTISRNGAGAVTFPVTITFTPLLSKSMKLSSSQPVTLTLTPALSKRLALLRAVAATAVITPAMGKLAALGRTFAVTSVMAPALSRRLSAYRTFAVSGVLSPILTPRVAAGRLLAASTAILASMTKAASKPRSLSASVTLTPVITYLSGKGRVLSATVSFALTMKRTIAKTISTALNFTPKIQRRSTMTLSASLALNPALQASSRLSRIFDMVTTLSAQLTRRFRRVITLPASLTMTPSMLSGRITRIVLSVTTNFTALIDFLRFIARKPIDALFGARVDKAQLLAATRAEATELQAVSADEEISTLLSVGNGEIPELEGAGAEEPSLRSVT